MRGSIGTDLLHLRLCAREVDADMAVKIIVSDVVGVVRRVVCGGHVHSSVAEHYPHGFRRPGGLATESPVHFGSILSSQGFCVSVRAHAEDIDLPADAGGEVIDRRIGEQAATGLDLAVPVGVAHLRGADGGTL